MANLKGCKFILIYLNLFHSNFDLNYLSVESMPRFVLKVSLIPLQYFGKVFSFWEKLIRKNWELNSQYSGNVWGIEFPILVKSYGNPIPNFWEKYGNLILNLGKGLGNPIPKFWEKYGEFQ